MFSNTEISVALVSWYYLTASKISWVIDKKRKKFGLGLKWRKLYKNHHRPQQETLRNLKSRKIKGDETRSLLNDRKLIIRVGRGLITQNSAIGASQSQRASYFRDHDTVCLVDERMRYWVLWKYSVTARADQGLVAAPPDKRLTSRSQWRNLHYLHEEHDWCTQSNKWDIKLVTNETSEVWKDMHNTVELDSVEIYAFVKVIVFRQSKFGQLTPRACTTLKAQTTGKLQNRF